MTIADWISLATPMLGILGTGVVGVAKLTRMTVALEEFVKKVDDHETRLRSLESSGAAHQA